ncbi:undecaprenyl-diphosphate phosphatase [Candidatus Woesearchaeota archaeon]|nr:undecaprenyl-diphosphate phosphatase [Candidatus Woesearchaeota archaeon]
MNLIEAIILAIIQGITEWLPVSSSGHLAILEHFFGIQENIAYDVLLHFATLLVILFVFRKRIIEYIKTPKYWLFIIIGTIPIVIVGFLIEPYIQSIFNSMLTVGIMLLITATLLHFADKTNKKQPLNNKKSLVVGLFQALAIMPGISRSGSTISSAKFLGISKKEAVEFSFILAIPAILGATILKINEIKAGININMIIGFIIAVIISYFFLNLLIKIVQKNKLKYFSYYCLVVGLLLIIYTLI